MSDLEMRLAEFWKADAMIWRKRTGIMYEIQSNELTKIDLAKQRAEAARMARLKEARGAAKGGRVAATDSRIAAERAGLLTYMGQPCKRGHSGLRYIRNHDCLECAKLRVTSMTPGEARKSGIVVKGLWESVEIADSARTVAGFNCVVCRNPFTPKSRERRPPLYCSNACRNVAYRQRKRDCEARKQMAYL